MCHAKSYFFHDKINDCCRSNDPTESLNAYILLSWKKTCSKMSSCNELSVNDNIVSDPKAMAEAFIDYFFM